MGLPFWAQTVAGYEGAAYADSDWNVVTIGGQKLPGLGKVRCSPTYATDIQKPNGSDAAAVILRGYVPGPIEIEVLIWTPEHWDLLQAVMTKLWRKPNKSSPLDLPGGGKNASAVKSAKETAALKLGVQALQQAAVSIEHPGLGLYGISQVVVTGVSLPEEGPAPQSKIVRIKCVEYVPATTRKSQTRKTKGTKSLLSAPKVKQNVAERNSAAAAPSETDGGPKGPPVRGASGAD